jgi:LuxR family maltose regulon positive regulatory protein
MSKHPNIGNPTATHHNSADTINHPAELKQFLRALLTAWEALREGTSEVNCRPPRQGPLSEREEAILDLIAEGLSNKAIARTLSIAPETVKSHVKHIFVKLNAESRTQAVARAQSLGFFVARRDQGLASLQTAAA